MKKIFILLLFAIILTASDSESDLYKVEATSFDKVKNGTIVNKDGVIIKVINTKRVKGFKVKTKMGYKKHGVSYHYQNNKLKYIKNWYLGKKDGSYKSFFSNGELFIDCYYKNDKKHGMWTQYNNNGNIFSKCNYINGKASGTCKQYYKNKVSYTCEYTDGEKNGECIHYDLDGKIRSKDNWKDGKKVGKTEYY